MKYWRPPAHPKFVHLQRGIKQKLRIIYFIFFDEVIKLNLFFITLQTSRYDLHSHFRRQNNTLFESFVNPYLVIYFWSTIKIHSFFSLVPLLSNCRSAMGVVFITNAKPWPIISCLQQRFRLITLNLWLLKCWS